MYSYLVKCNFQLSKHFLKVFSVSVSSTLKNELFITVLVAMWLHFRTLSIGKRKKSQGARLINAEQVSLWDLSHLTRTFKTTVLNFGDGNHVGRSTQYISLICSNSAKKARIDLGREIDLDPLYKSGPYCKTQCHHIVRYLTSLETLLSDLIQSPKDQN